MSIKSTQHINRKQAERMLQEEIPHLSNGLLGDILDLIANTGSTYLSYFDNFIIDSDIPE